MLLAYPELVSAAKETFKRLLDVHSGKIRPFSPKAQGIRRGDAGNALDGRRSRLSVQPQ